MADDGPEKPFFDPPESLDIWNKKWNTKFNDLILHGYFDTQQSSLPRLWVLEICESGYKHIVHFYNQATELNIGTTAADFPSKPAENPWADAETVMAFVERHVREFEEMKIRGKELYGSRCQDFELGYRRRVNEFLPKVWNAREEEWWRSELWDELVKADEEQRKAKERFVDVDRSEV